MKKSLLLLLIFPLALSAQISGPGSTLTLQQCIDIALKNNFDLLIDSERIDVAEARLRSAFGEYLPTISANAGYNRQLNNLSQSLVFGDRVIESSQNPNRYNASSFARLTLFDGFSREYNYSSADYNLESAKSGRLHLSRNIRIQVYRAYTEVIRNQQIVRIRQENLDLGRNDLKKIKAQYKAGVSALPEVYSQEAELGNLEFELLNSKNTLYTSKANLLNLMGLEPDLDVSFDNSSVPNDIERDEVESFYKNHNDKDKLINIAFENRLDLKSFNYTKNAAEAAKKATEGSYFPTLSASTGWSWANTEVNEFSDRGNFALGFNLSVPIFNNFRTDLQVQNAELQLKQSEIEKQRLQNQIRNEVKTSLLSLEISQKQLIVTEKALNSSKKNYESVSERYKVGVISVLELQRANAQYINSQLNRVNAVYNYYKAKKELLNSIGKID